MIAAVQRAIDTGVTCFDTAPHYGRGASEILLGNALGSHRKEVLIVTKCSFGFEGSASGRPKGRDSRKESIPPLVDQSLQRMRTDYIDVLLVHVPDINTPFEETMCALDNVAQQWKVRAVGVSNFTLGQLKACEAVRRIDVVQYGLNMFDRRVEREMHPYCLQQDIGVIAYAPVGYGLLTGAFTMDTKFGQSDIRGTGGYQGFTAGILDLEHRQRNLQLVEDLKPIAAKRGKTMSPLALRWVLSHPAVSVALVGTENVQELVENLGSIEWEVSGQDLQQIDEVFAKYGVDTHPKISLDP